MVNKRYALIVLPTFLLSWNALADNLDGFYIKASYFDAFFNTIGPLEGKEDVGNNTTEGVFSFNKNERIRAGCNPKYIPGLAGGIAVGYILENVKIEFESLYSQTNLYSEDYSNKDKAKYVELRRNECTSVGTECSSPWRSKKVDVDIKDTCENIGASVKFRAAFQMRNEGFNNLAGLVNIYYDFSRKPFTPYISIGGGLTKVKFLGRTRYAFAYQTKLGANYQLTTQMQAFAGLRYFGILGNQFENIVPTLKIPAGEQAIKPTGESFDHCARIESSTATITNRFGIYGLEAGLTYYF
ncbi:MAG: P44/Msp2 family outer membrane protein [Wolbachia endosymbiont of Alcedoecus sp.]|nr:P44/Msp2 family outer membrane protein [Wolbachia endosymbiont of Alcedoecus sp.]